MELKIAKWIRSLIRERQIRSEFKRPQPDLTKFGIYSFGSEVRDETGFWRSPPTE